jgi:hypothetical protein
MVPFSMGALAPRQGVHKRNDDLAGGISSGFAVLSIRGKAFRVKHQGNERILMRSDGDGPRSSVDVVIVKSSPAVSKIFYINGYSEGSNSPPDCFSIDGIKPEPTSPKLQNPTCLGCPQNAWGSAVRPGGPSKGKACADSKRLAIVPSDDIENEMYGGPMLMRVPPASLGTLKAYADYLSSLGYAADEVVTRISFDPRTEYPALTFQAIEELDNDKKARAADMRKNASVDRILNTAADHVEVEHEPAALPGPMGNLPPKVTPVVEATAVEASIERVAEVEQKVTGDPNAAKRAAMKAAGVDDTMIDQLLGPEPKEEPKAQPEDPRIAGLKAAGLTDEQIKLVLSGPPADAMKPTRRGRPKKEEQAQPAPVQAAPEEAKPLDVKADEPKPGALPPDFEDALAKMLGPTQTH